jgi:hypothetical protein
MFALSFPLTRKMLGSTMKNSMITFIQILTYLPLTSLQSSNLIWYRKTCGVERYLNMPKICSSPSYHIIRYCDSSLFHCILRTSHSSSMKMEVTGSAETLVLSTEVRSVITCKTVISVHACLITMNGYVTRACRHVLRLRANLMTILVIPVFKIPLGGVSLSPLCTWATNWPTVPASDDRRVWRIWWNGNWKGKPKYSEKTCPSGTWFTTNPTRPDLGSRRLTAWAMARPSETSTCRIRV